MVMLAIQLRTAEIFCATNSQRNDLTRNGEPLLVRMNISGYGGIVVYICANRYSHHATLRKIIGELFLEKLGN